MTYYKFTDSIIKNRPVELNNNGEMYRDMTYMMILFQEFLTLLNPVRKMRNVMTYLTLGIINQ